MAAPREGSKQVSDISAFVKKQLKLLELERNAEIAESIDARKCGNVKELEKRGVCVTKLYIRNECTGLYGKYLVSFGSGTRSQGKGKEKANAKDHILSHSISSGDIVGVSTSASELTDDNIASGVVTKVTDNVITVAFEDQFETPSSADTFKLIKLCNDVTYKRLKIALETLKSNNKNTHLKDVLFHQVPLGVPLRLIKDDNKFTVLDESLNECQIEAVKFALNQKEIGIIHGPPGTGKTTTVIEVIQQSVKHFNFKVLACAPSNIAVDNLVAKLADAKIKIIRLGHPARVYPNLQKFSLDAVLMRSDSSEIIKNVRDDIQRVLQNIKNSKDAAHSRKLRGELKFLKKELYERELKAIKHVLSSADVILSTTTTASADGPLKHLNEDHFDLVVIDEAAQALEASCWIPLSLGNRCLLAGDHQQLPPTILSQEASKKGLEITLMERAIKEFGTSIVKMLTIQYRMNNAIMSWPSNQLYGGKLIADHTVGSHLLSDLHEVTSDENTSIPLLFVDTAGCFMYEFKNESEESKGNQKEVELVVQHVEALLNAGVKQEFIGIITPYNLQVELIRQAISLNFPNIEIRSVDGFQGREKEAIIISLVRSNDKGEVGFLKEDRRMNVAITRARRHLAVIGDSATISSHPFLKSFYEYVSEFGEIRTAQIYAQSNSKEYEDDAVDELLKRFEDLACFKGKGMTRGLALCDSDKSVGVECNESEVRENVCTVEQDDAEFVGSKNGKTLKVDIDEGNSTENVNKDFEEIYASDALKDTARKYTKEDIENIVIELTVSENEDTMVFDSSLDSTGRFWVHEMAEKYGLAHWSVGEGKDRCISIKKRTKMKTKKSDSSDVQDVAAEVDFIDDADVCNSCGKEIPKQNKELHALRCIKVENAGGAKAKKGVAKKDLKKKNDSKGGKKKKNEEEDVDALIAQFTAEDSICSFEKCKMSVLTLGQKCEFCVRTFCLKHGLAEVHGCGEAAKLFARKAFEKHAGKSKTKSLNDVQKNYVKRKLDEKIVQMEKKRAGIGKEKK